MPIGERRKTSLTAAAAKGRDSRARRGAARGPGMSSWTAGLKAWTRPVSSAGVGMGGMDMGGSTGSGMGMMSAADMKSLTASTGAAFDKMFLTMMIEHHKGAIGMAKTEQTTGKFADAKTMAGASIHGQHAAIDERRTAHTHTGSRTHASPARHLAGEGTDGTN